MNTLKIYGILALTFAVASGQHCAPFAGVEDSIAFNGKYRISWLHGNTGQWQYLRFAFQEYLPQTEEESTPFDKTQGPPFTPNWEQVPVKFSFNLPIRNHFYQAYLFISPTGNGFMVTGLPMHRVYSPEKQDDPALFHFYTSEGQLQHEVKLREVLKPEEIVFCGSHQIEYKHALWGKCLEESQADGCVIYYTFKDRPRLSKEGYFVEFCMGTTGRFLYYFLPLMQWVSDKKQFETDLELWLKGEETSKEFVVSSQLRQNLDLLQGLLHYPEIRIQNATQKRLAEMIPASVESPPKNNATDWSQWLEKNKRQLQWQEEDQQYHFSK